MALSSVAQNLKNDFKKYGVTTPLTDQMLEQFAEFYKFLMNYNKKYNLTRLTTFEEVSLKHFVDCLYVSQLTSLPSPLMDMGTGAGFPGVPLKIALPQVRIILVEGVQKKVEYLKQLRTKLNLKDLDIIGRNADSKFNYPVEGVITRAVETCTATLRNVVNCVGPGGRVFLMKTPGIDQEIEEAKREMGQIFKLVMNKDYRLGATTHERKLVIFERLRSNPE